MRRAKGFIQLAAVSLLVLVFLGPALGAQTIACPEDLASRTLQSVIDEVPAGGVLILQKGIYHANVVIAAPITILGGPGVMLRPEDPSRSVAAIQDTERVVIQGLTIDHAPLGFDISAASCSIVDCSITTSEIGVDFLSLGQHAIVIQDCTLRGQGVGLRMVGTGTALVSACRIEVTGPGMLVGGTTTLIAVGCTITYCGEGIVAWFGANVFLHANALQANMLSGLRLSEAPPEVATLVDGVVCATDNRIADNINWGIVYGTLDSATCGIPDRQLVGTGNTVTGNGYGAVCPADLIPEGFLRVDESD